MGVVRPRLACDAAALDVFWYEYAAAGTDRGAMGTSTAALECRRSVLVWWPLCAMALLLSAGDFFVRLTYEGRALNDHAPWSWLLATGEWTIPTWFSMLVMFGAGLGCLRPRPERNAVWNATGVLFCYLAIDDLFSLHETFGIWLHPLFGDHGVYVWVSTIGPVFAVAGLVCGLKLLRSLSDQRARRACLFFGFAGLAAALAIEVAEDRVVESGLRLRGIPLVSWTQWVEETLETLSPTLLFAAGWTPPAEA